MSRTDIITIMSSAWRQYVNNLESPDHTGVRNGMDYVLSKMEQSGLYYKKETIECHVDGVKYVYTEEKLGND